MKEKSPLTQGLNYRSACDNTKNFEVCFSGLIAVTACYAYSFNSMNIAL